jgi:HPt (histidine-containing phosphotransfer) domain-containing protein
MDDFVPKPLRLEGLRYGLVKWTAMAAKRGEEKRQSATTELRENLLQRTGYDDESLLNEYIGLFLQDTSARLDRMKKAFAGGSLENFAREAHSLKGACLELGADRMVRYCDDLSSAIASEHVDEVAVIMGKLDGEFKRLRPVYETVQVTSISPS